VAQARALDDLMERRDPLIVVDIAVPETELVRRLSSRLVCEDCGANAEATDQVAGASADAVRCRKCGGTLRQRSDDNESVIRERLRVYRRDTQPLVDYYRTRSTFRSVNGAQALDRVAADLAAAVSAVAGQGAGR
jgi:adenylate kinase